MDYRPDTASNGCTSRSTFAGELVLGHFQIVAGLEIHPECRRVLEVAGEAQCGVRGNPTPLVDDIGDSSHRFKRLYLCPHVRRTPWLTSRHSLSAMLCDAHSP